MMPIAGLTLSAKMPCKRSMRKPGGKVASEMARRAWFVDFVKMVRFNIGPAIVSKGIGNCLIQGWQR